MLQVQGAAFSPRLACLTFYIPWISAAALLPSSHSGGSPPFCSSKVPAATATTSFDVSSSTNCSATSRV